VSGRVQGVGFRWWTSRAARRLGLTGSVRNEPDGSVVVVAWGEMERLAELEHKLRAGPPGARVENVARLEAPTGQAPAEFGIGG
jgi:acylphosphatase